MSSTTPPFYLYSTIYNVAYLLTLMIKKHSSEMVIWCTEFSIRQCKLTQISKIKKVCKRDSITLKKQINLYKMKRSLQLSLKGSIDDFSKHRLHHAQ